ncbi:hypothetical protein Chor_003967, partial [Crotalus horridus]
KNELSCKKSEVFSLQEQLKREINEKKLQASLVEIPKATNSDPQSVNSQKNIYQHFIPVNENIEYTEKSSWTPAKVCFLTNYFTYTVKTPPKSKLLRESTNLVSEGRKKKRKVILELDSRSDSSDNTDLLSIVTEQEMFKKLNKDYSESSHLYVRTPKQIQAPSILKTPGSSMKLATVRKMREAGWTAISKIDRRKKMKEAGKLFT